jgi:hypothetical protein
MDDRQFPAQQFITVRDLIQTVVITYLAYLSFAFSWTRCARFIVPSFSNNSNKMRSLFVLSFCCTITQCNNTSPDAVRAALSPSLSTHLSQGQRTTIHNIHINIVCVYMGGRGVQQADEAGWNVSLIHAIVVTVFNPIIFSSTPVSRFFVKGEQSFNYGRRMQLSDLWMEMFGSRTLCCFFEKTSLYCAVIFKFLNSYSLLSLLYFFRLSNQIFLLYDSSRGSYLSFHLLCGSLKPLLQVGL